MKDVPTDKNIGKRRKVEENESELEDFLVKKRNEDTREQQEAEQVSATQELDRKEGGESSETVDNPNIDDIFDEYDEAEGNLAVGIDNSNETTGEDNDNKSGKKESRERGKKTKDVVRDIYNRAKGSSSVLFEQNSVNEDNEEADQDEFMPSTVDYRRIIERAMEKSATEVRKIAYFDELQTRAMKAKKYSYAWFNTLLEMESINCGEANSNSREVSISFSAVEREPGTKRTLILKYPNRSLRPNTAASTAFGNSRQSIASAAKSASGASGSLPAMSVDRNHVHEPTTMNKRIYPAVSAAYSVYSL